MGIREKIFLGNNNPGEKIFLGKNIPGKKYS
jgi:hypothetical protein